VLLLLLLLLPLPLPLREQTLAEDAYFCRYVYDDENKSLFHIHTYEDDWQHDSSKRNQVPPSSPLLACPCLCLLVAWIGVDCASDQGQETVRTTHAAKH